MIAAGLTRAALPDYSKDSQNGAVDFKNRPVLTHPLAASAALELELPAVHVEALHSGLAALLADSDPEDISLHFSRTANPSPPSV